LRGGLGNVVDDEQDVGILGHAPQRNGEFLVGVPLLFAKGHEVGDLRV
jgi:hypothetical protein